MNEPAPAPPSTPVSSAATTFIDVTAKLSLLMAVLAVIWCLLQLLLVGVLGRLDLVEVLQREGFPLPPGFHWLGRHAFSLTLLCLLLSAAFLAVSWGLLRRREWGRIGFIVFLVIIALANFASLPLLNVLFDGLQTMVPAGFLDSSEGRELRFQLQVGLWTALIIGGGGALAIAALHAWLVVKLGRPDVRTLFH